MDLLQMLREEIRSYIEGRSTLSALRGWLADHAQDIVDAADPELDMLDGRAWILISEFDLAHRDEASIRVELQQLMPTHVVAREVTGDFEVRERDETIVTTTGGLDKTRHADAMTDESPYGCTIREEVYV